MAFTLTIVYIVLTYVTPAAIMSDLAPLRVQVWVVALAGMASLPELWTGRFVFRGPQIYLLGLLVAAISLSRLLGQGWPGGVVPAWLDFLPSAAVFLLIVVNVTSMRRLRILQTTLAILAVVIVVRSVLAFHYGNPDFIYRQGDEESPETMVFRLRALGIIGDPNDFAQFLLMMIPIVWLRWRPGFWIRNLSLVVAPTALIIYGMALTRSRGALVALAVVAAIAAKDRVGWVGGAVLGGAVAGALLIANFAGGREISVEGGADRLEIWSDGLQMVKGSPLWGVGYRNFTESSDLTAHNSFLLCAAELGIPGYLVWLALFVVSLHQLRAIQRGKRDRTSGPGASGQAVALQLMLFAFLATAWFLSRAYLPTPFLALGMAAALAEMESRRSSTTLAGPVREWGVPTAVAGLGLLLAVYVTVRLRSLLL